MKAFVDISGTPLNTGDKVAVQYQQLFRIGVITGFTDKKVVVGFDFSSGLIPNTPLDTAKLSPWKLAKVVNQNIGLRDYFQYIEIK